MDEIHILQLGEKDWNEVYDLPENVCLEYADSFKDVSETLYDMCFLDRAPLDEEIEPLYRSVKAYTLFVTEKVVIDGRAAWLCKSRKAQYISEKEIQKFLLEETKYYYPKPYGEKFKFGNLAISRNFSGSVKWNGNYNVTLTGAFGEQFSQVAFWRNNIPMYKGQIIDLWVEYDKSSDVSVSLVVTQFAEGSIAGIVNRWEYREAELEQIIRIESEQMNSYLFFSLSAKGSGELKIIALHDRYSRGDHGYFLPGGERYVTSNREEVFCYFEPADMRPPLNVYFSGYKTQQGFEGYYMMKAFGCPFLLVAEPRLEGGAFYMGTDEYEKMIINIIKEHMTELGFEADQVLFSGLSMGTFGALYYGCDIKPHAILLGKPLASVGNIAINEKYLRPGEFSTSSDILRYHSGSSDDRAVKKLNDRFWNKFVKSNWGNTKFAVSYMLEDDYDCNAYDMLLSNLDSEGAQVYGKGVHGRHNDNTSVIVNWFVNQFKKILKEDFKRRIENA